MGWLFGWDTRKQLIDHLVNGNGVKTLAHCFKGNDMWAVQEYQREGGPLIRFICLYMLRGRSDQRDGWGYKDVSEDMGPYQTSCPLSYLELVKDFPPTGYAIEWRQKVVERHALASRKLEPGQRIRLYSKDYTVERVIPRRGYAINDDAGFAFRMKSSQVKDVVLV